MDKYEKLFKGMEMCAGPDCNPECPYHGETRGGKTCRAWLLHDAAAAIANEEAGSDTLLELLHNTEAERDKLAADNKAVREAYKEIDIELHHARQREKELLKDKTDQPSAISDDLAKQIGELVAHANYQQGRADALAAIVERCSFGGGCRHE